MSKEESLKMLKDEITKKVDSDTLKKLENAKSKDEALAILEEASVELDEELLSSVSSGSGMDEAVGLAEVAEAGWCGSNSNRFFPSRPRL